MTNPFGVEDGRIKKKYAPSGDSFTDSEWKGISDSYVASKKGRFAQHRAKKHMSNPEVRAATRRAPTQPIAKSASMGLKMVGQAGKLPKKPTAGAGKSFGPALLGRMQPGLNARKNVAQSNFNGLPQRLKAARKVDNTSAEA